MRIQIVKGKFKITRDADEVVASSAAFFHKLMMTLRSADITCRVVHLERCPCLIGNTKGERWIICEDIDCNAKKEFNAGNRFTCIFSGSYKSLNVIKGQLKEKGIIA